MDVNHASGAHMSTFQQSSNSKADNQRKDNQSFREESQRRRAGFRGWMDSKRLKRLKRPSEEAFRQLHTKWTEMELCRALCGRSWKDSHPFCPFRPFVHLSIAITRRQRQWPSFDLCRPLLKLETLKCPLIWSVYLEGNLQIASRWDLPPLPSSYLE